MGLMGMPSGLFHTRESMGLPFRSSAASFAHCSGRAVLLQRAPAGRRQTVSARRISALSETGQFTITINNGLGFLTISPVWQNTFFRKRNRSWADGRKPRSQGPITASPALSAGRRQLQDRLLVLLMLRKAWAEFSPVSESYGASSSRNPPARRTHFNSERLAGHEHNATFSAQGNVGSCAMRSSRHERGCYGRLASLGY